MLTSGETHAPAATMEEAVGDDNNQRSSIALSDDSRFSIPDATNVNHKSMVDDDKYNGVKFDEEVSDSDATKELEEETMGGRATTTRSNSTIEEDILSSKESSAKSDNGSNETEIFGTVAEKHGVDAAADEYLGNEGCDNHNTCALGTGKSNESSLQAVETRNESNRHRLQYNQSFLPSSTQSNGTVARSSRNEKQDEYVKKGARVKALLASALQAVADGLGKGGNSTAADRSGNDGDEVDVEGKSRKAEADFVHVQDLAQKKSEECITLKRVSSCYLH